MGCYQKISVNYQLPTTNYQLATTYYPLAKKIMSHQSELPAGKFQSY